jgi:anti-sigma factor RsiW
MRCRSAQELIIAATDGELSGWRRSSLDRHLAGCEACRAERATTERLLRTLDAMPVDATMPARLEQEVLRRVRHAATEPPASSAWLAWLGPVPSLVATAVVAVVAFVSIRGAEPPIVAAPTKPSGAAVARATPPAPPHAAVASRNQPTPSDPPPALAAQLDLFVDMPVVRNLDKLKHFDAIATMDVDDGTQPSDEEAPTNG